MIPSCAANTMKALSGLQSTVRCSELLAGRLWSAAPSKRNLTSGTVREAARQAKATLLRSTTVASAAQADRQATAAAPGFVDLAVDDRVLVSAPRLDHTALPALRTQCLCNRPLHQNVCRDASLKALCKPQQLFSKQQYLRSCLAKMWPCNATQGLARCEHVLCHASRTIDHEANCLPFPQSILPVWCTTIATEQHEFIGVANNYGTALM